jgi:hypothetical protein
MEAESDCDEVARCPAEDEGPEEFALRHLEGSRGQDKWRHGHRRGKECGDCDGQDGVLLHPLPDEFKDSRGDALFKERHSTGQSDTIAQIAADCGADGGHKDEHEPVRVPGCHQDKHDVGDTGDRQGDERRIDDGDQEKAEWAEGEEEVQERRAVRVRSHDLERGAGRVVSHDRSGSRGSHTGYDAQGWRRVAVSNGKTIL